MITAIVMMNVQRKSVKPVIDELMKLEGITEVYPVAGEFDIVAIIRTKNSDTLSKIVADIMPHRIEDITHTKTLIALDAHSKIDLAKAFGV